MVSDPPRCPLEGDFKFADPRLNTADSPEINIRLFRMLEEAGSSPLGLPGTVDTFKDMLARAGLALGLA